MIDSRRFVPLLAAVGLVVAAHQVIDIAIAVPSTDFATPAARVRQFLVAEARTPAALTADLFLIWAMIMANWRGAMRLTGWLHLLVGVLLILALPFFLMDAGRIATGFGGTEVPAFRVVVARTLVMFLALGVGALLAGRALRSLALKPVDSTT